MDWTKLITESALSTAFFAIFMILFTKYYEKEEISIDKIGIQSAAFFVFSIFAWALYVKYIK